MEAVYSSGAPWLHAVIVYLECNLKLVRGALIKISGIEMVEPEGIFLLWINFNGPGLDQNELYSFLRADAKWSITRGHSLGKEGIGFARVNIACTWLKLEAALNSLMPGITGLKL